MTLYCTLSLNKNNSRIESQSQLSDQQRFDGASYDIGVASIYLPNFIKTKTKRNKNNTERYIAVFLEELEEQRSPLCEYNHTQPFVKFDRIVFQPLAPQSISNLCAYLTNRKGEKLDSALYQNIVLKLVLKPRDKTMRCIRLSSTEEKSIYPQNEPFQFTSTLPAYYWNNVDFSHWEVALHSILIPTSLFRKFIPKPTVLNIAIDAKLQGQIMDNNDNTFSLADIPLALDSIKTPIFYYAAPILQFQTFASSYLHNITLYLKADYKGKLIIKDLTNSQKDTEVICNLCIRHKYEEE